MKLKNNIRLLITCDSGAGAGKTTASKYLSKKFGLNLLTSCLLYRYVAYKILYFKMEFCNTKSFCITNLVTLYFQTDALCS